MTWLPNIFVCLAALAAVLGVYWLWRSLRLALSAEGLPPTPAMDIHTEKRDALLEEKENLVRSLNDLAFDRDLDKLSKEDFERLDKELRARTKQVLRALDEDLGPYRERAEALIAERIAALPAKESE